jgi:hypothetical protein
MAVNDAGNKRTNLFNIDSETLQHNDSCSNSCKSIKDNTSSLVILAFLDKLLKGFKDSVLVIFI